MRYLPPFIFVKYVVKHIFSPHNCFTTTESKKSKLKPKHKRKHKRTNMRHSFLNLLSFLSQHRANSNIAPQSPPIWYRRRWGSVARRTPSDAEAPHSPHPQRFTDKKMAIGVEGENGLPLEIIQSRWEMDSGRNQQPMANMAQNVLNYCLK